MTQITEHDIEQLVAHRTSLKERAKAALAARKAAERAELDAKYDMLCDEARVLMREVLQMTPGEIADVTFTRTARVYDQPCCEFRFEGWYFKVYYEDVTVAQYTNAGEIIRITGDEARYEYRPPKGFSFSRFETLADLAKQFG